jgi:hypothetical protein
MKLTKAQKQDRIRFHVLNNGSISTAQALPMTRDRDALASLVRRGDLVWDGRPSRGRKGSPRYVFTDEGRRSAEAYFENHGAPA